MEVSQRRFGVEIECGGNREALMDALYRRFSQRFHAHSDGSGNEIHTGILKGKRGINRLQNMLDVIREAGGYVSTADGMHVHHDAPEFIGNRELQARLVRNFLNMEEAFDAIIAPYRRGNYSACAKTLHKGEKYRGIPPGRGKLNFSNLHRPPAFGTVEFRGHEGCLHPAYAAAWVAAGQALLDRTVEQKYVLRTCSSVKVLTRRLGVDADVAELLIEKAANVTNPGPYRYR